MPPPSVPVDQVALDRARIAARAPAGGGDGAPMTASDRAWSLTAICAATGLLLLNVSAPNVALPAIGTGLHASFADLEWVLSAYALALASVLLTAGSLADLLGRRRMFLVGLAVFAAASAVCAMAPTPLILIGGRAAAGVGGAIVLSSSLALLAQSFSGADRARALGLWGATIAAAFAVGPLEGGLLTDAWSWRAIFWLNVLVALPVFALSRSHLRESRDPDAAGVDFPGTVALTLAVLLGVFALIQGNSWGWLSPGILGAALGSAVLLCVFVFAEVGQQRPMFDLRLFATPTFTGASLVAMLFAASSFGPFVYVTLFLLRIAGVSPAVAGLQLLPFAGISLVAALLSGRLSGRVGVRSLLLVGMVLAGAGLLMMRGLTASSTWLHLLPGLLVSGVGIGMVNPAITYAALAVVPTSRSGMASGVNNTFRQLGIAAGIAGFGGLLQGTIAGRLGPRLDALPGLPPGAAHSVVHAAASGDLGQAASLLPAPLRGRLVPAYADAFAAAINQVFLVAAVLSFAGAAIAVFLVRAADFDRPDNAG